MRLRGYHPGDVEAMYLLDALCFAEPFQFDLAMMQDFAEATEAVVVIAEENDPPKLTGFIILHLEGSGERAYGYIVTIDVAESFRRQGVGSAMLHEVEAMSRSSGALRLVLHVAVDNANAIRFYESQHYRRVGTAKRFYREAEQDALVFAKAL